VTNEPARPKGRRRLWRWAFVVLLVPVLVLGLWLPLISRAEPERFAARRAALVAAAPESVRPEQGGFVSQAVSLRATNGLAVNLRVLRPAATPGKLPLIIVLGGHRTGRDAVDLLGAPGSFAVAALDYPYDGPERPRGIRQVVATIPAARRALEDTPAAVLLALDWLVQQPWADAERVELVGVSLGVPFATVAGALDPRVKRVWLIHGGSTLNEWMAHNLRPRFKSDAAHSVASWLAHRLAHGPSLEAEHWLPRIAPRPVVIIGAREDQRLPAPMVERLHALAGEPKELIWMDGGHIDRRPEAVQRLLEIVRERIARP